MTTAAVPGTETDKTMPVVAWITMLTGFWPVGLAVALIDDKREEWIKTHYRYMMKTLLAGLIYCAVSFVLIGFLTFFLTGVWYLARCVKGLVHLSRNEAIPNPGAWIW